MKSYVHLLGRLVCLQASPYYLLRSAGVVWVVPAITYVSYNGVSAFGLIEYNLELSHIY